MRKRFWCAFCFILFFLLTPFVVNAKSASESNIYVEFGNEDTLTLEYTGHNQYTLNDNNTFYYNGILYSYTQEDVDNGSIEIEGETLTFNEGGYLVGELNHDVYSFYIKVSINYFNTYKYSQEICYKYGSVEACNIDSGDSYNVNYNSDGNSFFYGFLPFYSEDIVFDYIYYNLRFENINNSKDVVTFTNLGFDVSKGDNIF